MNKEESRNFCCLIYEDSMGDYETSLLSANCNAFVSPWHEGEVKQDGSPKKKHKHILVMFSGKRSLDYARELFDSFGGVYDDRKYIEGGRKNPDYFVVGTAKMYALYLCHLDANSRQKGKPQYPTTEVESFGEKLYTDYIQDSIDDLTVSREIINFIENENICSFRRLVLYCMNNNDDWFRYLCNKNTYFIKEFIKSRSWELTN